MLLLLESGLVQNGLRKGFSKLNTEEYALTRLFIFLS